MTPRPFPTRDRALAHRSMAGITGVRTRMGVVQCGCGGWHVTYRTEGN